MAIKRLTAWALPAAVFAAILPDTLRPAPDEGKEPAPIKVDYGEIRGARFAIANPPGDWNRRVLLIAHGYRPERRP